MCGMSRWCARRRAQGRLEAPRGLHRTPRVCPLGHRVGGWVIHFPPVVCTSSPSTPISLRRRRRVKPRPCAHRVVHRRADSTARRPCSRVDDLTAAGSRSSASFTRTSLSRSSGGLVRDPVKPPGYSFLASVGRPPGFRATGWRRPRSHDRTVVEPAPGRSRARE
jgi:hypothetical protein